MENQVAGAPNGSIVVFDAASLSLLLVGLLITFLGIAFAAREGGTRSSLPYLAMCVSAAAWLIGESIARSLGYHAFAPLLGRIALTGAALFPVTFLWFTHRVIAANSLTDPALRIAAGFAGAVIAIVVWPGVISMNNGAPVFAESFAAAGWFFGFAFVSSMLAASAAYATQWRRRGASDHRHRRTRLLLVAGVVGSAAGARFLPPSSPLLLGESAVFVALFFGLTSYVLARYRASDITPALVGAQIAQILPDALLVLDRDATIRQINPAAERLLNVDVDKIVGTPVRQLLGRDRLRKPISAMLEGRPVTDFEIRLNDADDEPRTVSVSASAVKEFDESPRAFVFILRDISTRKAAEERIRELAYFDALTGLPNRSGFLDAMNRRIDERRVRSAGLLFLDLDRFKLVNDTLGHDAGDKMLAVVARRLQHCLRQDSAARCDDEALVARFGGDEFVVAVSNIETTDQVVSVCQRILQTLAQPIDLGGQEVFTGASIGVSRYPQDGKTLQALLKCADLALYEAKDDGRNGYQIYDETLAKRSTERAKLEADIRLAIEREDFHVHFQPIVDHRTHRIVGAEALLRWQHPRRGAVSPADFVPVAEEIGVMSQLGEYVLDEACKALYEWRALGFTHLSLAVNLSDHQFRRDDLAERIAHIVRDNDIVADRMILELTEEVIMNDGARTRSAVAELKALGVRIGVDDFGTGYSSFSHLKQLGVDIIKVDGRFTRSMADQDADGSVARAIVSMAQSLNLQVIAEGVENQEQADRLAQVKCHFMQGYLHGAPMTAEDFGRLLLDEHVPGQPDPTLSLPAISLTHH